MKILMLGDVVGNPGRIVRGPATRPDIDLNHGDLPDPVADRVHAIESKLEKLEQETEDQRDCENCTRENCPMKKERRSGDDGKI